MNAENKSVPGLTPEVLPFCTTKMATTVRKPKGSRGRLDDLVAVSAEIFQEQGYDATSMQDIADEFGVLKGSLYHYVQTKEDLLWMIVEAPLTELVDTVGAIFADAGAPFNERLRRAIAAHCESFENQDPHMFVITRENGETLSQERQERLAALRDRYHGIWRRAILAAKRSGDVRPDVDVTITVQAIFGMINWMFRWFNPGGRLSAAKVADQFASILERGISVQGSSK